MINREGKMEKDNKLNRMTAKHLSVLVICCLMAGASIGLQSNIAGVFYTPVTEDLGIGRGTFTMHVTVMTIAGAIMTLFVPRIMEKVSYKKLLIVSVLVNALGTAAMGIASQPWQFNLLGAVRGLANVFYFSVPITIIINSWFVKNHGTITSLAFSFSGIAGALFSPIMTGIINSAGWRTAYYVNGALMIAFCLPGMLISWHLDPRDDGLLPYGFTGEGAQEDKARETAVQVKPEYFSISYISICLVGILVSGICSYGQHFPGYAASAGMPALGATLLSFAMIGNITSKFIMGVLTDRVGAVRSFIVMVTSSAIGLALILLGPSPVFKLAGAVLYGAIQACGSVGIPLVTRSLFGARAYNAAIPVVTFTANIGYSALMMGVGYIYDSTRSYSAAFLLGFGMIAMIFLSLVLAIKNKPKEV